MAGSAAAVQTADGRIRWFVTYGYKEGKHPGIVEGVKIQNDSEQKWEAPVGRIFWEKKGQMYMAELDMDLDTSTHLWFGAVSKDSYCSSRYSFPPLCDGTRGYFTYWTEDEAFDVTGWGLCSTNVYAQRKILVLPYPNNPTGAIMTKEDLEPIAEIVKKYDLYVLSDEIYSELTYKSEHVSIASLPGMKDRTLVINGFSKGFAMTGWRLGYICGQKKIMEQMIKIHQYAIMCAPTNSQYAAIEGLRNCEGEVQQMRNAYNQRRRYLVHEFKRMQLDCFEPFGAFYIFPSIQEFGMTSEEFATRFLEEEKVAVVPGSAFGECGEGYLRVSYAYSLKDLKEAIGRLGAFVGRLRNER